MGKSSSTVYRMRRRPGPLRFVVDGRRVYVELESLESLLSPPVPIDSAVRMKTADAEAAPPAALPACNLDSEGKQPGVNPDSRQEQQPGVCCRSGQRELIIVPRPLCGLFFYLA
jgi:hypothetical protein